MQLNWTFSILNDIIRVKDNIVFKIKIKYLIEKRRRGKKKIGGGLRFLAGCTQEGAGHSDAYSVQQGGRGGLKIGGKCVCN